MGQLDIVFGYTKKIEALLEKEFGAVGRGLHTKLDSVETHLPVPLVKKLRWVATMRNNLAHTDGFEIDDLADFTKSCDLAIVELDRLAEQGVGQMRKTSSAFQWTLDKPQRKQQSFLHKTSNYSSGLPQHKRIDASRRRGPRGGNRGVKLALTLALLAVVFTGITLNNDFSILKLINRLTNDNPTISSSSELSPEEKPPTAKNINRKKSKTTSKE